MRQACVLSRLRRIHLLICTLLASSSFASTNTLAYPRLGNICLSGSTYTNAAAHARYDLDILGTWRGWTMGGKTLRQVVQAMKALHPDMLVGKYTILMESYSNRGNTATADIWDKMSAERGPAGIGDWWAYDKAGTHLSEYPQTWAINIADDVEPDTNGWRAAQYMAVRDNSEFFAPVPEFDIWYCDNVFYKPRMDVDWNRDGINESQYDAGVQAQYRAAMVRHFDAIKALQPDAIIVGNVDYQPGHVGALNEPEYRQQIPGALMEGAIGASWSMERWAGWLPMMQAYFDLATNTAPPHYVVFNAQLTNQTDFQTARYAIASCLLNNGYVALSGTNYADLLWFDEYDQGGTAATQWLGPPIDAPTLTPWQNGVYLRRFTNGLALVNPRGNGVQTVAIPAGYRHLLGTQAPTVNNGLACVSVTLQDRDGLLLVASRGDTSWQAAASGLWTVDAYWTNRAPAGNRVLVANAGAKTVTLDASTPAANLEVTELRLYGGTATTNTLRLAGNPQPLTVNGQTVLQTGAALQIDGGAWMSTNNHFYLGSYGRAEVTVTNGTLLTFGELIMGSNSGADGRLEIQAGSRVKTASNLHVANHANSDATILLKGGELTTAGISVGRNGRGGMTVADGAWQAQTTVVVGNNAGSHGRLQLAGGSTLWGSTSYVGNNLNSTGAVLVTGGLLTVSNAAATAAVVIGAYGHGSLTVSNGTCHIDVPQVGYYAASRGELHIAGGSILSRSCIQVAYLAGSTGIVTLTGGELLANSGSHYSNIGQSGNGRLVIERGAFLANLLYVANFAGAAGTVEIHGGLLRAAQSLQLGQYANATGAVTIIDGLLVVTNAAGNNNLLVGNAGFGTLTLNGGATRVDNLHHGPRGRIVFNGGTLNVKNLSVTNGPFAAGDGAGPATLNLLNGTHRFDGGLTINTNAALQVAGTNAIGAATIAGSLTLRAGARLDWDGTATTQDLAKVTGTLMLEGPVAVSLTSRDGTLPPRIPLITAAGGITGSTVGWPHSRIAGREYVARVEGNSLLMHALEVGNTLMVQ